MTDVHQHAFPDTVLLLDTGLADPWVDYSQNRTNLADNGTYLSEANSARAAFTGYREIVLVWDIRSGETGILARLGNAVSESWRIQLAAANTLQVYENSTLRTSLVISGLSVSEDRKIFITWATHPHGSQTRTMLAYRNDFNGQTNTSYVTHATGTVSASDTLTIGAGQAGASAFSDPLDFHQVRIGRRFRPLQEFVAEWSSAYTSPPSMTQTTRVGALVPDRATLDVASDGSFAGPAHLWTGHAFEQSDRRLVGAILNFRSLSPVTINYLFAEDITAWWTSAPDDTALKISVAHTWRRPVPLKVNRAHVRVWVRMNNSTATTTVAEARLRMYSMNGIPVADAQDGPHPLVVHRTAQGTRQNDDGTTLSTGAWVDLGALDLARDAEGMTWLVLAVSFDTGHAQVANTEMFIHAITVDPYHDPTAGEAIDFSDP